MRGGAPWTGVSCWANRVVRQSGQAQAGSAARTLDGEVYTMSDMSGAGQAASSPHLVADDVHGSDGALVPARNLPLCPSSQWAGALMRFPRMQAAHDAARVGRQRGPRLQAAVIVIGRRVEVMVSLPEEAMVRLITAASAGAMMRTSCAPACGAGSL